MGAEDGGMVECWGGEKQSERQSNGNKRAMPCHAMSVRSHTPRQLTAGELERWYATGGPHPTPVDGPLVRAPPKRPPLAFN